MPSSSLFPCNRPHAHFSWLSIHILCYYLGKKILLSIYSSKYTGLYHLPSLSYINNRLTFCIGLYSLLGVLYFISTACQLWKTLSLPGKWVIDPSELTFVQEIGSGQFGLVHLGYWLNRDKVAIKTIQEGAMSEEDFVEEAEVMM